MAWCFHSKNDTLGIFACACFQTKSTLISVITCLIWNVESDCEANKTGQQIKLPGIFNKMWFGRGAALFRFPGHSLVLYTLKQSENENIWGAFEANRFERFYTFEHMVTRLALSNFSSNLYHIPTHILSGDLVNASHMLCPSTPPWNQLAIAVKLWVKVLPKRPLKCAACS